MAAYSLSPGLSGMGTVTSEQSTKDAGLFQMPMPGCDADQQILIDLFGTSRTITIGGTFVQGDSGYATIALFIAALDALCNGNQTTVQSYTSGKSGASYNVLITSVTWTAEEGSVNSVNYLINMTQGTT